MQLVIWCLLTFVDLHERKVRQQGAFHIQVVNNFGALMQDEHTHSWRPVHGIQAGDSRKIIRLSLHRVQTLADQFKNVSRQWPTVVDALKLLLHELTGHRLESTPATQGAYQPGGRQRIDLVQRQ